MIDSGHCFKHLCFNLEKTREAVPLVEFILIYLVLTRGMPGESYRRRLRSSTCVTYFERQLTPLCVDPICCPEN